LAEAQKYLNANYGGSRDPREAIPLLWNAVAKGNGSATLTLSDLYLRGDGVPQNCEQARLLLDIAAKKGIKGAAERLGHLQAFGCR
jgi:TPR repeat protein